MQQLVSRLTLGWMFLATGNMSMMSSSWNVCFDLLSSEYSRKYSCTPAALQKARNSDTLWKECFSTAESMQELKNDKIPLKLYGFSFLKLDLMALALSVARWEDGNRSLRRIGHRRRASNLIYLQQTKSESHDSATRLAKLEACPWYYM